MIPDHESLPICSEIIEKECHESGIERGRGTGSTPMVACISESTIFCSRTCPVYIVGSLFLTFQGHGRIFYSRMPAKAS